MSNTKWASVVQDIRRLSRQGVGQREIAMRLGISRNTVARYLAQKNVASGGDVITKGGCGPRPAGQAVALPEASPVHSGRTVPWTVRQMNLPGSLRQGGVQGESFQREAFPAFPREAQKSVDVLFVNLIAMFCA